MEFKIEIVPSQKAMTKEKAVFTRMDVLSFDERPDLRTIVPKLEKLVEKWNREYLICNFMDGYKKDKMFSQLTNVCVFESNKGDWFEHKIEYLDYNRAKDSKWMVLTSSITARHKLISVDVKYTSEFASLTFYGLESTIIDIITWDNKAILNKNLERKRETIKYLTYRIINALITKYMSKHFSIEGDIPFNQCLKHLIQYVNEYHSLFDRTTVIKNWKYAFGFIKKYDWAKPTLKQVMTKQTCECNPTSFKGWLK